MTLQCHDCKRLNPAEAVFCFYDGSALANGAAESGSSIDFSTWAFPRPFVFPSGKTCHNFLQLALALHRNPKEAVEVLQGGYLESFFGGLGRIDLAMAVRAAAKMPDQDRAVDELLGKLPGSPLGAAKLTIDPPDKSFGVLQIGEDRNFDLTLTNEGQRLLYGTISVDECPWLALGASNAPEKIFQFFEKTVIPVSVAGKSLRALGQPQKAELVIESNGGNFIVPIQVTVLVKPFPGGILSGATSPRQLAEKAKAHPKEAAVLLENGSVARWYAANGWTYPVKGPTASGIAAVQQLFEVLGLVKAPKVDLSEPAISLWGKPGERLEYVLAVVAQEKRPVVAYASSDQPWLTVGPTVFRGQMASVPLVVESVPAQQGQTLTARLKVTANGNQRFDVPVTLQVGEGHAVEAPMRTSKPTPFPERVVVTPLPSAPTFAPSTPTAALAAATEPTDIDVSLVVPPAPAPPMPAPALAPTPISAPEAAPGVLPTSQPMAALAQAPPLDPAAALVRSAGRKALTARLLPLAIVVIGLLTVVLRDMIFREPIDEPLPEIDFAHPRLDLHFHDAAPAGDFVSTPTMRFGLGMPDPNERTKFKTKLIYDEYGRTCNVCARVDKTIEYLVGVEQGSWKIPIKQLLGKDRDGHQLIGAKAVWQRTGPPPITITQIVEIVPGGLSADGKKRLLDTCLVRYDITNDDAIPHTVALRFLLDTFIGSNDAVPFTIAGAKELCDTMKSFNSPGEVPDYISALERQDLNNPGVVAHLSLKYGEGLEPPTRVTLGAWPAAILRTEPGGANALIQNTRWEVPVLPMALAKSSENPNGDSAVTMYWDDKDLPPKQTRTVGFAYGLGSVTGEKGGGQLGITAGGELVAEKEFTLTAYVKNPAPGTTVSLTLPRGLTLVAGNAKESVPALPAGASSSYSPVTWRLKALKGGVHRVRVALSSGANVQHKVVIKQAAEIFK